MLMRCIYKLIKSKDEYTVIGLRSAAEGAKTTLELKFYFTRIYLKVLLYQGIGSKYIYIYVCVYVCICL